MAPRDNVQVPASLRATYRGGAARAQRVRRRSFRNGWHVLTDHHRKQHVTVEYEKAI